MVTVTCKESNIEFEADSKRTQQHPSIAALKARANKDGNYREVNDALMSVKKQGGYATIEEYMSKVNGIVANKDAERTAAINARAAREREYQAEQAARKAKREQDNVTLKVNGYQWKKLASAAYVGGDDDDPDYHWELFSPDNRCVTVGQALDEIARGRDVVLAEMAAKTAESKRLAEEKARAESEQRIAENQQREVFDSTISKKTAGLIEVEQTWRMHHAIENQTLIASVRGNRVWEGEYHGTHVILVLDGVMYDDDGYYSLYAGDPEAAGLTPLPKSNERKFF